MSTYEELSKVDVREFTKKKGKFSYLSWASAVDVLLKHFPDATWVVIENGDGWPYVATPAGCFVTVSLTINDVTRTQVHPVLDNRNNAVKEPDAFQINTSIQRCLAKAISLHGLGLYIYRGEDLPEQEPEKPEYINEKQKNELVAWIDLAGTTEAKFAAHCKVTDLAMLPANKYDNAVAALKERINNLKEEK